MGRLRCVRWTVSVCCAFGVCALRALDSAAPTAQAPYGRGRGWKFALTLVSGKRSFFQVGAPREKAGGEYIELRGAFYDVWPLHRGLMTRFPAPLLEIAATSVRRPRGDPLPFHSLPPCFPTPDPAPCTCHLNTHRDAKCFPRAPAQPRCVYPSLEAAGEARLAIYTHISRRMHISGE